MDTKVEEPDLSNPRVQNAYNMDDEVFENHMNNRHRDSLGGLEDLYLEHCSEYVVGCWRKFHETLHRIYPGMNHDHGPYRRPPE